MPRVELALHLTADRAHALQNALLESWSRHLRTLPVSLGQAAAAATVQQCTVLHGAAAAATVQVIATSDSSNAGDCKQQSGTSRALERIVGAVSHHALLIRRDDPSRRCLGRRTRCTFCRYSKGHQHCLGLSCALLEHCPGISLLKHSMQQSQQSHSARPVSQTCSRAWLVSRYNAAAVYSHRIAAASTMQQAL